MQLEISVRAARDLRELHGFGLREYGAARADAYLAEMFEKFDVIAQWPLRRTRATLCRGIGRLTKQRAHNILYMITGNTVLVLRVFHHSANWIDLL